ncbi:Rdx family protein [Candidatus Rariloculus sp.]|uniref:Rdx family protein n=1 Tax=Candidatus Rariloculus sp. TaxID=3101265 RepID=UPI003D0ADD38
MSERLGFDAELEKGYRGVFDVVANGTVVFSKHDEGRFPDHSEILDALRALT